MFSHSWGSTQASPGSSTDRFHLSLQTCAMIDDCLHAQPCCDQSKSNMHSRHLLVCSHRFLAIASSLCGVQMPWSKTKYFYTWMPPLTSKREPRKCFLLISNARGRGRTTAPPPPIVLAIFGGNFLPPTNFCVTDDASLPSQFDSFFQVWTYD